MQADARGRDCGQRQGAQESKAETHGARIGGQTSSRRVPVASPKEEATCDPGDGSEGDDSQKRGRQKWRRGQSRRREHHKLLGGVAQELNMHATVGGKAVPVPAVRADLLAIALPLVAPTFVPKRRGSHRVAGLELPACGAYREEAEKKQCTRAKKMREHET